MLVRLQDIIIIIITTLIISINIMIILMMVHTKMRQESIHVREVASKEQKRWVWIRCRKHTSSLVIFGLYYWSYLDDIIVHIFVNFFTFWWTFELSLWASVGNLKLAPLWQIGSEAGVNMIFFTFDIKAYCYFEWYVCIKWNISRYLKLGMSFFKSSLARDGIYILICISISFDILLWITIFCISNNPVNSHSALNRDSDRVQSRNGCEFCARGKSRQQHKRGRCTGFCDLFTIIAIASSPIWNNKADLPTPFKVAQGQFKTITICRKILLENLAPSHIGDILMNFERSMSMWRSRQVKGLG